MSEPMPSVDHHFLCSYDPCDCGNQNQGVRVLICGSRTFAEGEPIRMLLAGLERSATVIHGAAKGADSLADQFARLGGFTVEKYPARWTVDGKAAGPIRNQRMLDEGKPDVVWAFVDRPLVESKGTADMVRRAKKAGIPVFVTHYLAPEADRA